MTRAWGGAAPVRHRGAKLPPPRPRPEHLPDIRPAAGHYLLAGIEAAVHHLSDPTPDIHAVADDLRAALARTAACGDTCRIRTAADDVRLAAALLLSDSLTEAHEALDRAQANLRTPYRDGGSGVG
jgi:hypothetical protein